MHRLALGSAKLHLNSAVGSSSSLIHGNSRVDSANGWGANDVELVGEIGRSQVSSTYSPKDIITATKGWGEEKKDLIRDIGLGGVTADRQFHAH